MRRGDGTEKSSYGSGETRQESEGRSDWLHPITRTKFVGTISRVFSEGELIAHSTGETNGEYVPTVSGETWFDRVDETSPLMRMGPEECKGEINQQPISVTPKQIITDAVEDLVNHPSHYTDGSIECIDAIQAQLTDEEFRGYLKGNIAKYIWREKHKGGTQSIEKGAWYLNRLIQLDKPDCMRPFITGFDD